MSENNQTIPIRRSAVNVPDFVARQQSDASQPKEKYPSEVIPLPTKGWFYPEGHPLASGEIEIKQMTAREEDILANQELMKKGKVLDKLMEAVIINKEIKFDDILIPDVNAIFIAIRRLAYGDEYPVSITCPQCNVQNKIKMNLSELAYKSFNFDEHPKGQNSFTFKLPMSGVTVTYKLLNQADEQLISSELTQLKKISKDNTGELTTRLKYLFTSIDGNPDRANIRKFVEDKLTARDSLALRRHIKEHNPDIDVGFNFKCYDCGHERRLDMPMAPPFYGLTLMPEDKVRIHKEIFHLVYNSNGGFTHDEAYSMPVTLRYFYLKMLIEQKEVEARQAKNQEPDMASKTKPKSAANPNMKKPM